MALTEVQVNLTEEMKSSYIDYAMSVIVGRALPDVRDGLKPVHRRILYAMYEQGMTHDQPYKKSARVVGDVMGKYHPHGDAAIYETMVRMAQTFSMRYPLIDGQGNFGSIDGDPAAAMRYTEVRLTSIAEELLADIEKNTVDFVPNYDGTLKEPLVLPGKIPNLLLNGSTGIAVGMATNIPPHNLRELSAAIIHLIDQPSATLGELMQMLPGPDFPTGGYIVGRAGIEAAYSSGRGSIILQAKSEIEEGPRSTKIVFTELPYQVNKAKLIEDMAELVKGGRLEGISDLRDESDKDGIRLVVEVKAGFNASVVLNQLHKHTALQSSYGINNMVLVDGLPKTVSLKEMLEQYIYYRSTVIERRTRFDLDAAEKRAHILAGLLIALRNIDEVIRIIKAAPSPNEARDSLMQTFSLSEEQGRAILDMRLQRLTGLEQEKIVSEAAELEKLIARLRQILSSNQEILAIIKQELAELAENYGDERRTAIIEANGEVSHEDLIQEEDVAVTITSSGYIKRQPLTTYRSQRRGGKGVIGAETKSEEFVTDVFTASTRDYLLFFTDKGKAHWLKVYEVPSLGRAARGKSIVNLLQLEPDERITGAIPVKSFDSGFIVLVTRSGSIVKMPLQAFSNPRKGGIKAVNLKGDSLVSAKLTDGSRELLIATKFGKAIRFKEEEVRASNRGTMGVKAISLSPGDELISMDVIRVGAGYTLLTITNRGYGKRTEMSEYPLQKRGGMGVKNIDARKGFVCCTTAVSDEDELLVTTKEGVVIRIPASEIRVQGRATQGVRIMNVKAGDEVVAVARIS
ncbi:MAG TPA: DNA gyrase subunit A [Methanothrix sp.]|nr:DNA gyrase subunit A [Methanothrix sp.]HQE87801.1 DNA gyrase subunit A [Methanothrix sp.]HQI68349.1 DNA gyrase subunit A [Methanothrix sp.]HRT17840.1 DNA gyrase subunit A [Methanothrix sp.]